MNTPSRRPNGVLEDIGAEIGFTATTALVAWFAGKSLYIPEKASLEHPIARAIGIKPMQRLAAAWGAEVLHIPEGAQDDRDRRDRLVAEMLIGGASAALIAERVGVSARRVHQLRIRLSGMIDAARKEKAPAGSESAGA